MIISSQNLKVAIQRQIPSGLEQIVVYVVKVILCDII